MDAEVIMDWPHVDTEMLQLLPAQLRAIVRALGVERARDWLETHGGTMVKIAVRDGESQGLTAEEMERMRITMAPHMLSDRRISVPKVDKLWQYARNTSIHQTRDRYTIREQALAFRLTTRQVINIRREAGQADDTEASEKDTGQLDLFKGCR
jgi:hypothetical protein